MVPEGADADQASQAAAAAGSFAAGNGMQLEQRSSLSAAELPAQLDTLIVLAPDPGVQALAAAAPQARIFTVGFAPAEALPNVSVVQAGGAASSLDAAFIAGYMAAMSAHDWRTGILYSATDADLVQAYRAGAAYFCGLCIPSGPPNSRYPIAAQAVAPDNWQAAVDQLMIEFVRVVYLTPDMEASGAGQYLATYGVQVLGSSAPPPELAAAWIASVSAHTGPGLQTQLEQALAGQPAAAPGGVSIEHLNTALFSEARRLHVDTVIQDLLSGAVTWQNTP